MRDGSAARIIASARAPTCDILADYTPHGAGGLGAGGSWLGWLQTRSDCPLTIPPLRSLDGRRAMAATRRAFGEGGQPRPLRPLGPYPLERSPG